MRRPKGDHIVDPKHVPVPFDKHKFRVLEFLCPLQLLHALLARFPSSLFRVSCTVTLQLCSTLRPVSQIYSVPRGDESREAFTRSFNLRTGERTNKRKCDIGCRRHSDGTRVNIIDSSRHANALGRLCTLLAAARTSPRGTKASTVPMIAAVLGGIPVAARLG